MAGIDDLIASEAGAASAPSIDHLIDNESGSAPQAQPTAAAPQGSAPGMLESGLTGFAKGVGNVAGGVEQLAGKGVSALGNAFAPSPTLSGLVTGQQPKNLLQRAGDYLTNDADWTLNSIKNGAAAAEQAHPYVTGAGDIAGGIAATAPVGALARGGALVGGALSGAAGAAAQPVAPDATDYWSQKAQQVGAGAATGGALGGAVGGLSSLIGGANVSPAARDLMARGVPLTPGQILGGGANRLEQQLTSTPFIGSSIADARNRGIAAFNRSVYNDALDPLGVTVPANVPTGGAAVDHVRQTIGQAYDAIEPQALFNYDGQFHRDLTGIRNDMLAQGAPQSVMDQFDNIVRGNITGKMDPQTGEMTGPQWGHTRSQLNTIVRNNTLGQPTADQSALANGVSQLGDAVNSNVMRNSPAGLQDQLTAANQAYARYKTLEKAAGYTGARNSGNVFTPAQYSAAVGARSTAAAKSSNTGLNADLAQNAQQVLGTTVPDSGTAGRGWLTSLLLAPHIIAHPGVIAGGVGARAAYSPTGVAALQRLMTQRPAVAQALGRALNPVAMPAAAGAGAVSGGLLGAPDEQQ